MGTEPLDRLEVLGGARLLGLGLAQPPSISAGVVQKHQGPHHKAHGHGPRQLAHLIEWKGWSAQRAGLGAAPCRRRRALQPPSGRAARGPLPQVSRGGGGGRTGWVWS